MTEHRDVPPIHWHGTTFQGAAGSPFGVVTPAQLGETYRNTTNGDIWVANGLTSISWILLAVPTSGMLILIDQTVSEGITIATGTTVFQTKLTWTPTGAPFTGLFRFGWRSEFSHTPGGGDTSCQVVRTDGGAVILGFVEEQADDASEWADFSGFVYLPLVAATPVFIFQFRTIQALQNALARRVRFEFMKAL